MTILSAKDGVVYRPAKVASIRGFDLCPSTCIIS